MDMVTASAASTFTSARPVECHRDGAPPRGGVRAPRSRARGRVPSQRGQLEAALAALDAELKATLAGLGGRPFIVFHDVTQYFESRYGLNSAGSITVSPEQAPEQAARGGAGEDRGRQGHLRVL